MITSSSQQRVEIVGSFIHVAASCLPSSVTSRSVALLRPVAASPRSDEIVIGLHAACCVLCGSQQRGIQSPRTVQSCFPYATLWVPVDRLATSAVPARRYTLRYQGEVIRWVKKGG